MPIVVPFVPPSGMPFCSLIDISYVIKVYYFTFSTQIFWGNLKKLFCDQLIIDPGFFHGNVVMRLDIIIGSVRNPNVLDEGRHSRNVTSAIFPPSSSVVSPDRVSTGVLSCNECQHVDSRKFELFPYFLIGVEFILLAAHVFFFKIFSYTAAPPTYEECELTGFSLFRGSPAIKKKVG